MALLDKALYKKALRQVNNLGPHAQDFNGEVGENPCDDSDFFLESSHALWLHPSPNVAMTLAHARPREQPAQDPCFVIGIAMFRDGIWDHDEWRIVLPFSIHKYWDQGVAIFMEAAVVITVCLSEESNREGLAELKSTMELVDGFKVFLNEDGTLDIRNTVKFNVRARAEALGFPEYMWTLIM